MTEVDMVSHPPHYTAHPSGVETLEVTRLCPFDMGNALKYIWRYADKNGAQDLKKARFYLNDILVTGQAHHPPYKVKQMLGTVIAADDDLLRRQLFVNIMLGQLESAIGLISKEVDCEEAV